MNPITREEQYLNRLTGEEGIIPDKPVTREEQYFARLCGGDNVIPDKPVTRREQYLATLCGEDVITPTKPVTRIEQYMAFASGESESKPEKPITREEMYWDKYQGGDVPEEKTIAFTDIITVTDALARPAVDLQSEITATQNLNGYDYPWVGGAGKNLLQLEEYGHVPSINNGQIIQYNGSTSQLITIDNTKDYVISFNLSNQARYLVYYDINQDFLGSRGGIGNGDSITNFSDYNKVAFIRFRIDHDISFQPLVQLEQGSTASAWTPYENICPISGRTEVNVTRTGKNLCPYVEPYTVTANTSITKLVATVDLEANQTYTFSCKQTGTPTTEQRNNFAIGKTSNIWDSSTIFGTNTINAPVITITPTETRTYYVFVWTQNLDVDVTYSEFQTELGSTATAYEPYEGDTFNTELGRTVYGGTLDLTTGELTITHAYVDLGDLTWTLLNTNLFRTTLYSKKDGTTNFTTTCYRTVNKTFTELQNGETASITLSEHGHPLRLIHVKDERATTAEEFTTLVTGQKMVYELAEPQTISLTPTEVMMLENNNTIWTDSGRVQLTYLSKAAQRVQLMNASLKANTLKLTKGAIKE